MMNFEHVKKEALVKLLKTANEAARLVAKKDSEPVANESDRLKFSGSHFEIVESEDRLLKRYEIEDMKTGTRIQLKFVNNRNKGYRDSEKTIDDARMCFGLLSNRGCRLYAIKAEAIAEELFHVVTREASRRRADLVEKTSGDFNQRIVSRLHEHWTKPKSRYLKIYANANGVGLRLWTGTATTIDIDVTTSVGHETIMLFKQKVSVENLADLEVATAIVIAFINEVNSAIQFVK